MLLAFENINKLIPVLLLQNFRNFELSVIVFSKNLIVSLNVLKKHLGYNFSLLTCISGVDLLKNSYRFMLSYELLSISFNSRLRLKIFIDDFSIVISSTSVFINSNWWEREVWDMFGIFFDRHSDLRRILTDYGFEGYPLRKDFPAFGFMESYYDYNHKNVLYELIQLSQEYRTFKYSSPWSSF